MKKDLRQIYIIIGLFISSVSEGFIFGQMSGMVASLTTDTELNLSEDEISWFASIINVTCVIGFALAGVVTELIGRRRAISVLTIPILTNWLLLYYAYDFWALIVSRIIVGIGYGSVLLLVLISTSEYTSPNIRGLCLNLMSTVGTTVGAAISRMLCIILHWRTVALLGIVPALVSCIFPLFWVESPSWLASKGKYEECRESFNYLHGHRGKEARKELELLIECEKLKNNRITNKSHSISLAWKNIKLAIKQKYFWKLGILITFINVYRVAAGKYQYNTLAINMIQDITGKSDVLLYTTFVDIFFVTGSLLSCLLITKMKMRTLLFSTAILANIILLTLSACLYFQPMKSSYFSWINAALLGLYLISVNSGPYPVLEATFAELIPLEIRSFTIFVFAILTGFELVVAIKLLGPMINALGYHGTFLLNITLMCISLIYCWFNLIETKGRTMHEVELYIKTGTYEIGEHIEYSEQECLKTTTVLRDTR